MKLHSTRPQELKSLHFERLELRTMLAVNPVAADWLLELPNTSWASAGATLSDTAVDAAGYLVVLGEFTGTVDFDLGPGVQALTSSTSSNLFVAKYATTGTLVAVTDIGNFEVAAYGGLTLTLDSSRAIYLSAGYQGTPLLMNGQSLPAPEGFWPNVLFAKLSSDLQTMQWASYASPGRLQNRTGSIQLSQIAVDAAGTSVYGGGTMAGKNTFGSIEVQSQYGGFVMRLDASTGEFQWVNSMAAGVGHINGVTVDPTDATAFYIHGANNPVSEQNVFRLDVSGNVIWEKVFPSTIAWSDIAAQDGGVYLAGRFWDQASFDQTTLTSAGEDDVIAVRLNAASGDVTWTVQAGGVDNDLASNIALDAAGSVFLAGSFRGTAQFGSDTLAASTTIGTTYESYPGDVYLSQLDSSNGSFFQSWRYGRATIEHLAAGGGSVFADGLFNAASIDFPTGDVPTSPDPFANYMMRFEQAVDPTKPRINGLTAMPDPAETSSPISVDIAGIFDPDARVNSIAFYHDVDGNRRLDTNIDVLLGVDADGSDGWQFYAPSAGLPLGEVQFLAQAIYDNGSESLPTSASTFLRLPSTTYVSTDVGQQIRDLSTVISTLNVPDSFELGDVDVTVSIDHQDNKDLDVYLIHPDGTRVELFTDIGLPPGENTNLINTILDDQADDSITSGHAPFTGRFQPEGLLTSLNGKEAGGTWVLEVTDDYRKDTGTLVGWSLTLAPAAPVAPTLSIDDVTLTEGDSGSTTAEFTVTRSGDLSQTVSVDYQTADDTATAGSDYTAVPPTTLTFAPGVASLPVTVTILGDTDEEPDESFVVNLNNPVGGTISDSQGVATILDDDGVVAVSNLYIADIRFESKRHDNDWRAVVEILDTDGNAVEGVSLKVDFAGTIYTLTTDSSGVARTSWERNLASGDYYADAYDLALEGYAWSPFSLNLEDDSDGDGKPDDLLVV